MENSRFTSSRYLPLTVRHPSKKCSTLTRPSATGQASRAGAKVPAHGRTLQSPWRDGCRSFPGTTIAQQTANSCPKQPLSACWSCRVLRPSRAWFRSACQHRQRSGSEARHKWTLQPCRRSCKWRVSHPSPCDPRGPVALLLRRNVEGVPGAQVGLADACRGLCCAPLRRCGECGFHVVSPVINAGQNNWRHEHHHQPPAGTH